MPQHIPAELRSAIALENARAEVAELQTPKHDAFGWMKGPNFNPVTGEYWNGPIGQGAEEHTDQAPDSGGGEVKGES